MHNIYLLSLKKIELHVLYVYSLNSRFREMSPDNESCFGLYKKYTAVTRILKQNSNRRWGYNTRFTITNWDAQQKDITAIWDKLNINVAIYLIN
jgi:hypothetical protein